MVSRFHNLVPFRGGPKLAMAVLRVCCVVLRDAARWVRRAWGLGVWGLAAAEHVLGTGNERAEQSRLAGREKAKQASELADGRQAGRRAGESTTTKRASSGRNSGDATKRRCCWWRISTGGPAYPHNS